jgi:predicted nucleotide-binding protein
MARRSQPPQPAERARPPQTIDQKRRSITRLAGCIERLEAFDPQKVQKRSHDPEVVSLEAAIDEALSAAFGNGTIECKRYAAAARLDHGPRTVVGPLLIGGGHPLPNFAAQDLQNARRYLDEGRKQSIALLQQASRALEDEIADQEHMREALTVPSSPPLPKNKVFVVHGHDEAVLQAVARFLEQIDLEIIVLREQPDQGRATIEKFKHYAGQVGFAVVLLTPDDLAGPSSAPASATRARQNVIFELGYFAGKLGRGRACLLRKGNVEIPSDLYGIIYKDFDTAGAWKLELVKELKAAELQFDANKVWS